MTADFALYLVAQMLKTAMLVAAPILITSLVVGVLVSILQVVTQIQEMTLTFVPKITVATIVILVFGEWMLETIRQFAIDVISRAAML